MVLMMSGKEPNFRISTKDAKVLFLNTHSNTPKINRQELKQNFACKGWNTGNSFKAESDGDNECKIASSSPISSFNAGENCLKRKPMLVEISNIEYVFKENKLKKCYEEKVKNPPHNFHNFVQMLCEEKLDTDCHRKRLRSNSFNALEMQKLLPAKKTHCINSFKYNSTYFIANKDFKKCQNLTSALPTDVTYITSPNKSFESEIVIQTESSPVNKFKRNNFEQSCDKNLNKIKSKSKVISFDKSEHFMTEKSNIYSIRKKCNPINVKKSSCKLTNCLDDLIENKIHSFNALFASDSRNSSYGNSYSSVDNIIIKDELHPVKDTLFSKTRCLSLSLDKGESDPLKEASECKFKSEVKSFNYDNKAFVKNLHPHFQEKNSSNKGSNWVQSLQWIDETESKYLKSNDDLVGKRKLRNYIPGGFAEQMCKLQKKERSDRVIWNYKMNEYKKKACDNSVTLTIQSVLPLGNVFVTKCYFSNSISKNMENILKCGNTELQSTDFSQVAQMVPTLFSHDNLEQSTKSNQLIVLFKKNSYTKFHLKTNDEIIIYPPWESIFVHSLSALVILCTYFVDLHHKSEVVSQDLPIHKNLSEVYYPIQKEKTSSDSYHRFGFDMYDKNMCISARIQRIWENNVSRKQMPDILKFDKHSSFSLLLQTEYGIFLELKMSSIFLTPTLIKFLSEAEGFCYKFYDLKVSHRYNLKKSLQFLKVLEFLQTQSENYTDFLSTQMFCYQLIPHSFYEIPDELPDKKFPQYFKFEIKPLSFLQKIENNVIRFSCIGKVLFQEGDNFYISDESLIISDQKKYYQIKCLPYFKMAKESICGLSVLVKEAVFKEGCLIIDQYSCCKDFAKSSNNIAYSQYQSRLKKICLINCEHVLSPLIINSKAQDFVIVKGVITHVDENGAISWLECSICCRENLFEDSNSVKYCKDCSCAINPVLKVKMQATIYSSHLPNAEITVQLLPSTIKRMLKISDDDFQPQCNIDDVLNKNIGILICCVKGVEIVNQRKCFRVSEVNSHL